MKLLKYKYRCHDCGFQTDSHSEFISHATEHYKGQSNLLNFEEPETIGASP